MLLISAGRVFPLDITNTFQVGRSLITAELTRLIEAKLITYRKSAGDGRRVELALTSLGETVHQRVRQGLRNLVTKRLAAYSREEILLCGRIMRDFRDGPAAPGNAAEAQNKVEARAAGRDKMAGRETQRRRT